MEDNKKSLVCKIADWSEIAEWLNVSDDDDFMLAYKCKKELGNFILLLNSDGTARDKDIKSKIDELREWVTSMSKADDSYSKPAFVGISKIKNDEVFLKWVIKVIDWLWV